MRCAMRTFLRIALALLVVVAGAGRSQGLEFAYDSFELANISRFDYTQATSVVNGALQVTYDVGSNKLIVLNASGQMTYKEPLTLWDDEHDHAASFNTSFRLNMGPIGQDSASNLSGGGMAFVLEAHPASQSALPESSYGRWLGLFNATLDGAPRQRLLAIEFDTFKDAPDPDGNHVGIDTNSTASLIAIPLGPLGVTLNKGSAAPGGTFTSIWIDYDGVASLLSIYLVNANDSLHKPSRPVISAFPLRLRDFLPQQVYVGFSASSGSISETHCVVMWNFTSFGLPSPDRRLVIGLSVAASVAFLLAASLALFIVIRRRRLRRIALFLGNNPDWVNLHYGPRRFAYRELRKATRGFSNDCKLGEGGFGSVYRGTLAAEGTAGGGTEVAVKCLSPTSKQGEAEFVSEVTIIGRLRHRNLVPLLGWCYDRWKGRLLLVYELMPNGSLDQWLKGELNGVPTLAWDRRYHVLSGLAAGLLYLHEEWEMVVVHRDIKPSNVMLDSKFNARLGDFGLARLIEGADERTINIAGTPGYMAPECLETGVVNKEADVYSFGAVALELGVGQRMSSKLLHWLWSLQEQGRLAEAADQRLTCYDPEQMEVVLTLGLACCHPDPASRPTLRHVSQRLASSSLSSFPAPAPASPQALASSFPFPASPQSPR